MRDQDNGSQMTEIKITPPLLIELLTAADLVTVSGRRLRSDPGTHELFLASLCNVLGRISELNQDKVA